MKIVKSIATATVIILLVGGITIANINLDQYNKQQATCLELSTESFAVINKQAVRVESLEKRLNNASLTLQTTIEESELREKLLVATAKDLQDQIDRSAKLTTHFDLVVKERNYWHRRVMSLQEDIKELNKTIEALKIKLEQLGGTQ